jgi:exosortase A-associated hydrolase 2
MTVTWRPEIAVAQPPGLLLVAPFAEEMNKSRRMLALMARAAARRGYTVMLPDLLGTGDSEGNFADAKWDDWVADVRFCVRQLITVGVRSVTLLGLRVGALLALEAAREPLPGLHHVMLWQPVIDGHRFLDQWLRLKVAARLGAEGDRVSTSELRAQLAQGIALEVAGYRLTPAMAAGLDAARLPDGCPGHVERLHWLELKNFEPPELSPASRAAVTALSGHGTEVSARVLLGPAFWMNPEITEAPQLIDATLEALDT